MELDQETIHAQNGQAYHISKQVQADCEMQVNGCTSPMSFHRELVHGTHYIQTMSPLALVC